MTGVKASFWNIFFLQTECIYNSFRKIGSKVKERKGNGNNWFDAIGSEVSGEAEDKISSFSEN